jgi:alpha-aminoadipic semialdehyde synthase
MENKFVIGIRREDKSVWERRAPLSPSHIKEILANNKTITFVVQPSKKRIFSDHEYEAAGATLQEDLSPCSLILGIKEVPPEKLIADKTFMYFPHVIKV